MSASLVSTLAAKAERDRDLPLHAFVMKAGSYAHSLIAARLHLHAVTSVGPHARTVGRPRIENLGILRIGSHVLLRSTQVAVELCTGPRGILTIGDGVRINTGTSIAAERRISIGDHVRIGPFVNIVDTDFHDLHDRAKRPLPREVVIEDHVWIGARASILRGVRVGRGAVIAVGAVVNRDVEPFTVVGGVPAKPIAKIDPARFRPERLS